MAFKFLKKVVFATDGKGFKTITYPAGTIVNVIPEKLKYQLDKDKKNGPFYEKIKNPKQEINVPEVQEGKDDIGIIKEGNVKAIWSKIEDKVKPKPKKKRGRKKK